MLGGSFWVAFLRNTISTVLMLAFFLMMDRPRFCIKKTVWYYTIFGIFMITVYSVWYLAANSSFVRFAALSTIPVIGVFCSIMSREVVYLSLYKIALAFYLFSVCTFCGVDAARWWFEGNLWVDVFVRFVCLVLILVFTWFKLRRQFLNSVDFLLQEMDLFSVASLFVSVYVGYPPVCNSSSLYPFRAGTLLSGGERTAGS